MKKYNPVVIEALLEDPAATREDVIAALRAGGYGGLYCHDDDCACGFNDPFRCGEVPGNEMPECSPGIEVKCPDDYECSLIVCHPSAVERVKGEMIEWEEEHRREMAERDRQREIKADCARGWQRCSECGDGDCGDRLPGR